MDKALAASFAKPTSEYRGAPFWAWNGKLEPEELRRQIRIMHRMGLGGFFMHSRVGLNTPYLSEEWMKCVDACVDEAEKLDMQAWLYDEDRWPSGAAGGLVTKDPKYRQRHMVMQVMESAKGFSWSKDVLAAFVGKLSEGQVSDLSRVAKSQKPKVAKDEKLLVFREQTAECNSWYNNFTYLDTMNHEAVAEFIRVTHDAYSKQFGKQFGKRIPGIFTDEPNYGNHSGSVFYGETAERVPWTPSLPQVFKQRYGYDLLDHLPELFLLLDGQADCLARLHFHDAITHLFCDAFARQVGEWCDKHGLAHTGHVLLEGSLGSQTNVVGSCMRFYEYMQAPGMDLLTEYSREYDTAKQVSSVARQFDRQWRLTETYGCTGWDFNFAGHKALGDWQAALGINLRCQHLSWYTMQAEAKRDYPAGIFFQSPWWEHYGKVEDYFARVNLAMSRGQEVRDVLVIHPIESMWSIYAKAAKADWNKLEKDFVSVRDGLLAANLDFDYGDEDIMDRHGKVSTAGDSAILKVAKADYRVVLVPPMRTIRSSTLKLLERFRKAGGTVIFAGASPELVDGQPSDKAREVALLCERAPGRGPKLAEAVAAGGGRRVSITDGQGQEIAATLYCLREDDQASYIFIANTGTDCIARSTASDPMVRDRKLAFDDVTVRIAADSRIKPVEVDLEHSGQLFATEAARDGSDWVIRTSLPAIGSRLFILPKKAIGGRVTTLAASKTLSSKRIGGKTWDIQLSEPNVLVLDKPRFRIDGAKWQKPMDVLHIDQEVRKALDIPLRGGRMAQPWTRQDVANPKTIGVTLEYSFDVKSLPTGSLQLAMERPESFTISLNGRQLDTELVTGWWVDPSMKTIAVDAAGLNVGSNTLTMFCSYTENHSGLEMSYLLGDFGINLSKGRTLLTERPTSLKLGDWTRQGLPFYSGNVSYVASLRPNLRSGQRLVLKADDYAGTAVRVLVDGQELGVLAWAPNEIDITEAVEGKKSVALTLQLLGHRRNSHGPLHLNKKWPRWTGPGEFSGRDNQIESYQLVPCGLMSTPQLLVRE